MKRATASASQREALTANTKVEPLDRAVVPSSLMDVESFQCRVRTRTTRCVPEWSLKLPAELAERCVYDNGNSDRTEQTENKSSSKSGEHAGAFEPARHLSAAHRDL